MRGLLVAFVLFGVLSSSVVAEESSVPPALDALEAEAPGFGHEVVDELASLVQDKEPSRRIEASLELRRLYADGSPKTMPRPKGFPALLASMGLLGHAGLQAARDWNTTPVPKALVSLIFGRARFDTVNMALYSLLGGLALLYLGMSRRWKSHKERDLWRLDELLRQDRARIEAIRRGNRAQP